MRAKKVNPAKMHDPHDYSLLELLFLNISDGSEYTMWGTYWHIWHDRAVKKAAKKSPRYAEIRKQLRLANGNIRYDAELFAEQHEIFWKINQRPVYWHVHHWWERHGVKARRERKKLGRQRAERGWADRDVWNLDSYLGGVMLGSITRLREVDSGHPGGMTHEEWLTTLDAITDGLQAGLDVSQQNYDYADRAAYANLVARFENAMDLLKGNWFSLWD